MAKIQDTGKYRTNIKDQFYTNKSVAKACVDSIIKLLPFTLDYLWIEPSAGNGSFYNEFPSVEKIGLDIDPKCDDIIKQDFLTWNPPKDKSILIVGNPPFGRQSSLAKLFISKSCQFADVIAFILPKSFVKPSMNRSFDLSFHLISCVEIEKNSFLINGSKYNVPCIFQIWQKKEMNRPVEGKISPNGFEYVKHNEIYDIAFRRVGALAGKCYKNNGIKFNHQTHYFLKLDEVVILHLDRLIERINEHIFPTNTVGPRSLSKQEVNVVVNNIIRDCLVR